jgi:hypothetical protein
MVAFAQYLRRGLLVIALSGAVFACGDDDDGDGNDAGAQDGGQSGSGDAGRGGAGSGGTDAGPTSDECVEAVADANSPAPAACVECLCDEDPIATSACDEDCWVLIACVQRECEGDPEDTDCIVAACAAEVGGVTSLMEIGMVADAVPLGACSAECPASTGDAGSDEDAGN